VEKVTLVFEPAEEGGFSAYVSEVPGANSQGETMEEAREMVLEALHELLDYRREKARSKSSAVFELVALG
jgi:predicted RNase H-like HicB family nuclease